MVQKIKNKSENGDSPQVKKLKSQAREKSIQEGIYASGSYAFGSSYVSPFAIALKSSDSLVALLSSVAGLLGPLSQMIGSKFMRKYSRKKIVLGAVLLEALAWLPFALIAFLFYKNILVGILPTFVLLIFAFYTISGNFAGPAWFSWMGDITEEKKRGQYFSLRNLLTGFVSMALAIIASFFLDYSKKNNWIMFGFMFLFLLAFLMRIKSWNLFKTQYEPEIKIDKKDNFTFWEFLTKAPKTNFGRYAIYRSLLAFGYSISAPLLAVYLLRNLGFGYVVYMIIAYSATIFSLMVMRIWGNFGDKWGNYRIIVITSILMPLIPLAWILNTSPIYLLIIPSLISGIAWAGFNLASGNFIYDNVRPEKRGTAISYYNMLQGIGVAAGAGVGAILIKILNATTSSPIAIIFIISAIVQMIVIFFGLQKIEEVKNKNKFDGKAALKNIIFKQIRPTIMGEAQNILSIPKYLK